MLAGIYRYLTPNGLEILCPDCARARREAGQRCQWIGLLAIWDKKTCADCGTVDELFLTRNFGCLVIAMLAIALVSMVGLCAVVTEEIIRAFLQFLVG